LRLDLPQVLALIRPHCFRTLLAAEAKARQTAEAEREKADDARRDAERNARGWLHQWGWVRIDDASYSLGIRGPEEDAEHAEELVDDIIGKLHDQELNENHDADRDLIACAYFIRGQARYELRRYAEALEDFNRFVGLVPPLQPMPNNFISWEDGHIARAKALNRLGRHARTLEDLEKALDLPHPIGFDANRIQAHRAVTLAHLGEHRKALATAEALAKSKDLASDSLFELGRLYAVASAKAAGDLQAKDRHAARAVELLRQAHARGFFKQRTRVEHLMRDDDFDGVRQRADYRKLIAELEAAAPKAPEEP
jgi:tetratricopeptide (TPR) repeat protein